MKPLIAKNVTLIVGGMTCSTCQQTIENHLKTLQGVLSASVSLLTHKAVIKYHSSEIGIRTLIEEIECLGFDAKYQGSGGDKSDIRVIVN